MGSFRMCRGGFGCYIGGGVRGWCCFLVVLCVCYGFVFFLNSFSRYLVQCVVGTYMDIGCDMEAH